MSLEVHAILNYLHLREEVNAINLSDAAGNK